MYTVKTEILLFAILGLISGCLVGIGRNLLPDNLFMLDYYPAIVLGIFLYVSGAYIASIPLSRNLLSFFILIAACIGGWRRNHKAGNQ